MKIGVEIGTSSLKAAFIAPDGHPQPFAIPQSLQRSGPPTPEAIFSLLRDHPESIEKVHGAVSSIVLAVPYQWIEEPNQPRLNHLETALYRRENLPLDYIYSSAVCSTVYLGYTWGKVVPGSRAGGDPFNLLYCDLGGRNVEICLCQVHGQRVHVIGYADSQRRDIQGGGEWFRRRLIEQVMGKKTAHRLISDGAVVEAPDHWFETLRIKFQDRLTQQRLEAARDNPEWLFDIPIHHLGNGAAVTAEHIWRAFNPVGKLITSLVGEVLDTARTKQIRIDQVVTAGGFSLFPPAREAIWDAIDFCELGQPGMELDSLMSLQERQYAPAFGAALIANDLYVPREPFPHRIGLLTYKERGDDFRLDTPSLIEPGSIVPGRVRPTFYGDNTGQRQVLYVAEAGTQPVPVFIQLHGGGPEWKLDIPEIAYPSPGAYYVGVEIDSLNSGKLHFVPLNNGIEHSFIYELGRFIAHEKLEVQLW